MSMDSPKYPHILQAVYSRPWALLPGTLALIVDILQFRVAGGSLSKDEIEARVSAASNGPRDRQRGGRGGQGGAVAVIPVYGVISQRQSLMAANSGGTSIEGISNDFRDALADPDVSGIVFEIDSPGGTIDGVDELAQEIRAARGGDKPIVAQANTMAASAAYWIAAACDELIVTPSGSVGSIGVFAAHEDLSAAAEAEGVKTTLVSAGKYKTEGNPWEPLGEEARANLQEMVDAHYGMFVSSVSKGRKVPVDQVRGGFGEGRLVLAKSALAQGMVDRIDTLTSTIGRVSRGAIVGRSADAIGASAHSFIVRPAGGSVSPRGALQAAPANDCSDCNHASDCACTDCDCATAVHIESVNDSGASDQGLGFGDRLAAVAAGSEALLVHARGRSRMKTNEGKSLSVAERDGLRAVAASLSALVEDPTPDPEPDPPSVVDRRARAVRLALVKAENNIT